jgi:hypothetical protein
VIDNVVWTDSWPNFLNAGCGLICVGEEQTRKVYAEVASRVMEKQVNLVRGTGAQ